MTDVERKHLPDINEDRAADSSNKVSRQPTGEKHVAAPTVEAFLRLGKSPLSAGDDAMDGPTSH